MSTYLELVQDLHREVGAAGNAPTTVVNQRGENQRLVRWIREADLYVQMLWHDWKFLKDFSFSVATVDGTRDYAKPSALQMWDFGTFRIDGDPIEDVEWEEVRADSFDLTVAGRDQPSRVIIMPDNTLRMDPVPNGVYTITADHFVKPTRLAADTDVSVVPEEFHESVILGRAMVLYGNFENAQEMKDQGLELYSEFLGRLESLQLPNEKSSRYKASEGFFEVIAE